MRNKKGILCFLLSAGLLIIPGVYGAFNFKSAPANEPEQETYKKYARVKLTSSQLPRLKEWERKMIPLLIEAAKVMDTIFWQQAFTGNRDSLLKSAKDEAEKEYLRLNYGPWDRLNGNHPFKEGYGEKPLGANYYPPDMTLAEFQHADLPGKDGLYTLLRRDENGKLITVPFHEAYSKEVNKAADLLKAAGNYAQDKALKDYLGARANALLTDDYQQSDIAWLKLTTNVLDIIIGPIETYEDKLFGYKAANEAYVLIKDMEWSKRLEEIAGFLPDLQKNLPVPGEYKQEQPGSNSQLAVYDVVYYAGDCNAGSKTIAVNLPNDEQLQLSMGTRRSQLKNVMQAKFDKILVPIANELIAEDQLKHIRFDAFFANTMFHEVAHGLGIKNTINGKGMVRLALKEHASVLEEGKADILGLYMITQLQAEGKYQLGNTSVMDAYVTFMAGIFRSVRFGAASAHGKANMIRFNFFSEQGAFTRDEETGRYRVNEEKMARAVNDLSARILTLQGNGDYERVIKLIEEKGLVLPALQADLDRLKEAGIPVDVVFEQGIDVLGLHK